jgi:heme/copper-type cytochrome/quinol oxidase subunit 2
VPAGTGSPLTLWEDYLADAPLTRRQQWGIAAIAIATVAVVLAIIAAVYTVIQHHRAANQATATIHVLDKRADCPTTGGTASCTWRIYTDAGVFADRDEVTAHKLNSKVLFEQLMYGGVYEVQIRGTRHDNLGQYPNIIKIVKVISQGHPNPAVVIAPLNA